MTGAHTHAKLNGKTIGKGFACRYIEAGFRHHINHTEGKSAEAFAFPEKPFGELAAFQFFVPFECLGDGRVFVKLDKKNDPAKVAGPVWLYNLLGYFKPFSSETVSL